MNNNTDQTPDYSYYPMVQTYVSLARSYRKKGQITDAFQRFERALDVCYMNLADDLMDDIRRQMLELDLADINDDNIKHRQHEVRLILDINTSLKEARFDKARSLLHDLEETGTKDPALCILKGSLALQENKKEDAATNLLNAAQYCYDIRAIKKARIFCEQVLRLAPDRCDAKRLMAEIYQKQGWSSKASMEMLELVRDSLKKDQLNEAFSYVQKAVEMGNIEAHFIQGLIYFHEGKLDEARQKFELVNNINNRHSGALSFLASIYKKQNLMDNALETYERLVKVEPNNPSVLFKAADLQLKHGMVKEAIHNYQKAARLFSEQGLTDEAEGAARMAEQLWQNLREEEKTAPLPVISTSPDAEKIPVPEFESSEPESHDIESDEPQFQPVSSQDGSSTWDLVSVYKRALQIDPHNTSIQEKLKLLEQAINQPLPGGMKAPLFFFPVSGVEMVSFSRNDKELMLKDLKGILERNAQDQTIAAKISRIREGL
ncbi:MAG: tetratricopeptide repeat protein [Elusimicrobia bacterium]|nr:tetratricopeptide repeat protein [Elusimicrobiota bacterium]MBD3412242.1 tetratricopeptide repeat protein [Elusimicrobiota bacterium]